MKNCKPRVLFTEKSYPQRQSLRFYLEDKGAEVYFACQKSAEIADEIKRINADVVVLDVYLTDTTAAQIKQLCEAENLSPKLFIAVSAFDNDELNATLMAAGFDAVLVKPFDHNILLQKLQKIFGDKFCAAHFENTLEDEADAILQHFYMSGNLLGRKYLRQAIAMAVNNPHILNKMTSELYPQIAQMNNTTASNVERSMRNAIKVAWERGNMAAFEEYFKYKTNNIYGKPTNSEFIGIISEKLRKKAELSKSVNR